jgi:SAM-dependent methyltransferase
MLDELAHAGPEHLDPAFVAGYERKQGYPDPAEDLAVLAAHGLDEASTVVDLGAGTGRFSLAAAGRFGKVTSVDISPPCWSCCANEPPRPGWRTSSVCRRGS